MKKDIHFNFKDLIVWQKAVEFADKVLEATEHLDKNRNHYRLIEQIESSVTSISANISEGKGRYSKREFIRFLYISRGSLYETISFLNIFHRRKWISERDLNILEELAFEIANMIKGLINSLIKSQN